MASRNPPLLDHYLALPPEASLTLLTGVLGASTNWLVLRYLASLLLPATGAGAAGTTGTTGTAVLLGSFLRDSAFWRDGASRAGVDLEALGRRGRFAFVDALGPGAADAGARLARAAEALRERGARRIVLVLDQPDVLAAVAGPGAGPRAREMVLGLREQVYATIMALSADEPLVTSQTTTLEKESAAFVLSAAHEAEMVLSLRLLDTGTAKDVSGVVRITRGGAEPERRVEEKEYLYHVQGDGGVRVFERGQ